jgi:hypothetical protein
VNSDVVVSALRAPRSALPGCLCGRPSACAFANGWTACSRGRAPARVADEPDDVVRTLFHELVPPIGDHLHGNAARTPRRGACDAEREDRNGYDPLLI